MADKKKKKKKGLKLAILLVVLGVLMGAYAAVIQYNKLEAAKESEEDDTSINLLTITNQLTKVSYTRNGTQLTFVKNGDDWVYEADPAFPLTQSKITSIVSAATNLNAVRLVSDNLDSAAEYGLAAPLYTVTLTDETGAVTTINIGNRNDMTDNDYVNIGGQSAIYTMQTTLTTAINYDLYDLMKVEELPSIASTDTKQIILATQNNNFELDYFDSGLPQYDVSTYNSWFFKNDDGTYTPANVDNVDTLIDTDYKGLSFKKCVNYNASTEQLESYGLGSSPYGAISIHYQTTTKQEVPVETTTAEETTETTTSDVKVDVDANTTTATESETTTAAATKTIDVVEDHDLTLLVGNKDEEGNYYVKQLDSTQVNTMDADSIDAILSKTTDDFLYQYASIVPIDTVNSIDVTLNGVNYNIGITRTETTAEDGTVSTTTTYTLNGAELSEDSFKAFYSAVIGIKADNSIKDPSTVSAQSPYITIVFNRNTQYFPTYTVTYTPYDSSFYQATVEGKTKLLINKLDINSLVEKIQALQTVSE